MDEVDEELIVHTVTKLVDNPFYDHNPRRENDTYTQQEVNVIQYAVQASVARYLRSEQLKTMERRRTLQEVIDNLS
jgi:hypothetical protein